MIRKLIEGLKAGTGKIGKCRLKNRQKSNCPIVMDTISVVFMGPPQSIVFRPSFFEGPKTP
jgi:hypothetical protein